MLYAPVLTPELEKQHRRHAAARQRIAAKPAHKPASIVQQPVASVETPTPEKVESWVDRQKRLWFWIEKDLGPVGPVTISMIQEIVCDHYGITHNDLVCKRRTMNIVLPRQVAMYLCKALTPHSLPKIGARFGGRDHTTCLSNVRKIERLMAIDPELAKTLEILTAKIKGEDHACVTPGANRIHESIADGSKAPQPSPCRNGIDAAGFDGPAVEVRK
jgi:hypothetical protein